MSSIIYSKSGSKIHIKEKNKGSFTRYCKGKVTQECIDKAKKSGNKKLIKKAVFSENSRSWAKKHQIGGVMYDLQTQQPAYGQPVPQSSTQATSPSTKPQQSPLAFMQQQASNLAQQTQNYTTTQNEKEALAQQQIEERNKKANSIGEQIGSVAGTIGMQFANNAYLKNQEKKGSMQNNMNHTNH